MKGYVGERRVGHGIVDEADFGDLAHLKTDMGVFAVVLDGSGLKADHALEQLRCSRIGAAAEQIDQGHQIGRGESRVPAGEIEGAKRVAPPDGMVVEAMEGAVGLHP